MAGASNSSKLPKEIDYISDLNEKYAPLELELEQKLTTITEKEQRLGLYFTTSKEGSSKTTKSDLSLESAKQRNYELLKSLEMSKARLRSRATFSPLETILQKAIGAYLKETALVPCNTKKIYGPTYV